MFNLQSDANALLHSDPVSSQEYRQITSTRGITASTFPQSEIRFDYSVSGTTWFHPLSSYFRIRCSLFKADGTTPLTLSDGIAPAENLMSHLFSSMKVQMNGTVVSQVDNFLPQLASFQQRNTKGKTWLDTVGATLNFSGMSLEDRIAAVSVDAESEFKRPIIQPRSKLFTFVDGLPTSTLSIPNAATMQITVTQLKIVSAANGLDVVANAEHFKEGDRIILETGERYTVLDIATNTPGALTLELQGDCTPLGVDVVTTNTFNRERTQSDVSASEFEIVWKPDLAFFQVEQALPSSDFSFILMPMSPLTYQDLAIESYTPKVAGVDFKFQVTEMLFYAHEYQSKRPFDGKYALLLNESRCQSQEITSNSYGSKSFDVSPSTRALTVAYQSNRCLTDTSLSSSKFKTANQSELDLNRMSISFAGQKKPQQDIEQEYKKNSKQWLTQSWRNTLEQTGMLEYCGGPQSLSKWIEDGPTYTWTWPRDAQDNSTRVEVFSGFSNTSDFAGNGRVLLIDEDRSIIHVQLVAGRTVAVAVEKI